MTALHEQVREMQEERDELCKEIENLKFAEKAYLEHETEMRKEIKELKKAKATGTTFLMALNHKTELAGVKATLNQEIERLRETVRKKEETNRRLIEEVREQDLIIEDKTREIEDLKCLMSRAPVNVAHENWDLKERSARDRQEICDRSKRECVLQDEIRKRDHVIENKTEVIKERIEERDQLRVKIGLREKELHDAYRRIDELVERNPARVTVKAVGNVVVETEQEHSGDGCSFCEQEDK